MTRFRVRAIAVSSNTEMLILTCKLCSHDVKIHPAGETDSRMKRTVSSSRFSLRGRRPKGRERGKNERAKAVSAKRVLSCFPPILPRSF